MTGRRHGYVTVDRVLSRAPGRLCVRDSRAQQDLCEDVAASQGPADAHLYPRVRSGDREQGVSHAGFPGRREEASHGEWGAAPVDDAHRRPEADVLCGQEEPKYLITPHDIEITYKPTKVDPIKAAKLEERKRIWNQMKQCMKWIEISTDDEPEQGRIMVAHHELLEQIWGSFQMLFKTIDTLTRMSYLVSTTSTEPTDRASRPNW